jgi:protein AATF/BFR2
MSLRAQLAALSSTAPRDEDEEERPSTRPMTSVSYGRAPSSAPARSAWEDDDDDDEEGDSKPFDYDAADDSGAWDRTNASAGLRKKSSSSLSRNAGGGGAGAGSGAGAGAGAGRRSALRARAQFVADIESDPKYAGKVVSARKALSAMGPSAEEKEDKGEEDKEEEDEDEEEEEDEDEDDDDEDMDEDDDGEEDDEEAQSSSADEDNSDDQDEDAVAESARRAAARAAARGDVDAELAALAAADAAALARYRRSAREDADKGKGAKVQTELFERWMEARIQLQGPLTSSNRLPRPAVQAALCKADGKVRAAFEGVHDAAGSLLVDLLRARASLLSGIPEVASALLAAGGDEGDDEEEGEGNRAAAEAKLLPSVGRKRARSEDGEEDEGDDEDNNGGASTPPLSYSSEDLWGVIERGWEAMAGWRDETVDKWGRRLAYAAGISAKKAVKLKVLGADISAQVQEVLADRVRVTSRTRMRSDAVRHLGETQQAGSGSSSSSGAGAGAGAGAGSSSSAELDAETYEDTDFYAALLKEFTSSLAASGLASSSASAGGALGYKAGYKHSTRDGVDRRASKSRRIRYVVHPKLAHFCAPSPYVVPPDMVLDLDTVVGSLFRS